MTINEIIKRINLYLAGEQLVYSRLEAFLDETIDDINAQLDAKFPTFGELSISDSYTGETEYNYFPDKYIRSVLIPGTVYKWYTMDEEGIQTAEAYGMLYNQNLFYMVRDYLDLVPEEYRADNKASVIFDEGSCSTPTPFDFETWSN